MWANFLHPSPLLYCRKFQNSNPKFQVVYAIYLEFGA